MVLVKKIRAPVYWRIGKKGTTWAVTPRAGPHPKFFCIPLLIIVRNILGYAETAREAKSIIKKGEILVDGKPRRDHKYPAGLFDVISLPKIKKHYRIVPYPKGLKLVEIGENESKIKLVKVVRKVKVKGGKIQLGLHDGKTILTDNNKIKPHDSLIIELPSLKIVKHIPLEKGKLGLVFKGNKAGFYGEIADILKGGFGRKWEVIIKSGKESESVYRENVVVVGDEKPEITIGE
ncbi:MAG: 30S ribosomal protein S4e [Candidatus Aenigmarchaeota archaeon]|nr:30S ribosomal protein S4e [Candidatus Aenigmarchaeota archaeon]